MAEIPIVAMKAVAERLEKLGLDAFLGDSVVGLLLDHPELSPVRAIDDVDVVFRRTWQTLGVSYGVNQRAAQEGDGPFRSEPHGRRIHGCACTFIAC